MKRSARILALIAKYRVKKREIAARLRHFRMAGRASNRALFEELAFCLLTPQSKAFSCDEAVGELKRTGLLFRGTAKKIGRLLSKKVRFHNKKAEYLVEARRKFGKGGFALLRDITFGASETRARMRLVREVKGMGMKEASHYLRNVGRGRRIAILDRHIIKNLARYGAIRRVPKSLTQKGYLQIERRMACFCRKIGIPLAHLDLLFWAEETGRVFK
ncbi:MAG: N-glycosylase/DNA lyase [Candidatus Micrarchaeota archaeon]|nr:N-glycosylase/DNA lyase [Candidatus Micrarchaeota archaeon]